MTPARKTALLRLLDRRRKRAMTWCQYDRTVPRKTKDAIWRDGLIYLTLTEKEDFVHLTGTGLAAARQAREEQSHD